MSGLGAPADTTGYWQQSVRYEIRARLDEPTGVLSGVERIVYVNNSPDTLAEFYLHLYLNAFRPGSRWAERDSIEGRRRFNDLKEPDFAFNHVRNVRIDGEPVIAEYPYAPDSTIVRFTLHSSLPPGDTMELEMNWDARPSTLPRRQGRRGRRFDFAQWYPRVVAYDRYGWQDHPLYPAGEFYGEFATFDVVLDVREDQVIGATGVPIEGDPGWERAKADRDLVIDYQRDWYASDRGAAETAETAGTAGCATMPVGEGRKCVRFYAEDVHHFAMSLNPQYVYEEGRYKDVVVRVLYLPTDRLTWGNGVAVRRTQEALRWLDELFGPYPWPQLTNVHRIEGGATEFPMMVMNSSAGMSLILHEVGHNYLMGILANNEWKDGFLDEGFSSFQATWYFEENVPGFNPYPGISARILELDLDGWSQPISTVSEDFRDFATYNMMIYAKAQLFYHQLRYVVGHETMREILREYYARWKLKHVTETALLDVAEDVSGMDLKWLFAQWLHGTPLYDYAIGHVNRRQLDDGTWETTVEVKRLGDGIMPVEIGEASSVQRTAPSVQRLPMVYARATGRAERETVTFLTPDKPGRLMLDPRIISHDWNFTNNRERRAFDLAGLDWRFDTFVREAWARDRTVLSAAPTVWYNDAAGVTLGVRLRSNYWRRFNKSMVWLSRGATGDEPATAGGSLDFFARVENPVRLRRPRTKQLLETWSLEGRTGGRLRWETERRSSWASPDWYRGAWTVQAMATRNNRFLDPALWETGGTVEAIRTREWFRESSVVRRSLSLSVGGGVAYASRSTGRRLDRRYDTEPFGRATAALSIRRSVGNGAWELGVRLFAGAYLAQNPPFRQRAIPLAGADPYETMRNPLVRSRGALFVRDEIFYHSPGNGNLRGYRPGAGGRWLGAVNVEISRTVYRRRGGILQTAAIVAFGDGGIADTLAVRSPAGRFASELADAGVGIRLGLEIGDAAFPLRLEFPLFVSRPELAHNQRAGTNRVAFRWLIGLAPSF